MYLGDKMRKGQKLKTSKHEYELIEVCGNGGQGDVWKAKNEKGVVVAIKVLRNTKGRTKLKRFKKEIEFQESTNSKFIVKVIDKSFTEDINFYVMNFYKDNLRDIMNQNPSPNKIIKLLLDVCKGLRYTHNKGAVHRDMKPENLFYDKKNDTLKIADYGIAFFKNSELTKPSERMANYNYRAPEQLLKAKKKVSYRTDIYSLGLIFNEMFTGEVPTGSNFKKIGDVNNVYSIFDSLIDRMIESDIDKRDITINEVIQLSSLYKDVILQEHSIIETRLLSNQQSYSSNRYQDLIIEQASLDVLTANRLLNDNSTNWKSINANYHSNIGYNSSQELINYIMQMKSHEIVKNKFEYESNVYIKKGDSYVGLDLRSSGNDSDLRKYESFFDLISTFDNPNDLLMLKGSTLKYFHSLTDYHCNEVIDEIQRTKEKIVGYNLVDAPIMWISRFITEFAHMVISTHSETFDLSKYIEINWNRVSDEVERISLYDEEEMKKLHREREVIHQAENLYEGISIEKLFHRFEIAFSSLKEYKAFLKDCNNFKETLTNDNLKYDIDGYTRVFKSINEFIIIRLDSYDFDKTFAKIIEWASENQ